MDQTELLSWDLTAQPRTAAASPSQKKTHKNHAWGKLWLQLYDDTLFHINFGFEHPAGQMYPVFESSDPKNHGSLVFGARYLCQHGRLDLGDRDAPGIALTSQERLRCIEMKFRPFLRAVE